MNKNADVLNEYRVFPRLFAVLYAVLVAVTSTWFMGLADPSAAQAGFVSAIATASAAYFKFYVESGKKDDPSN